MLDVMTFCILDDHMKTLLTLMWRSYLWQGHLWGIRWELEAKWMWCLKKTHLWRSCLLNPLLLIDWVHDGRWWGNENAWRRHPCMLKRDLHWLTYWNTTTKETHSTYRPSQILIQNNIYLKSFTCEVGSVEFGSKTIIIFISKTPKQVDPD